MRVAWQDQTKRTNGANLESRTFVSRWKHSTSRCVCAHSAHKMSLRYDFTRERILPSKKAAELSRHLTLAKDLKLSSQVGEVGNARKLLNL